jgi:hypothetical protein
MLSVTNKPFLLSVVTLTAMAPTNTLAYGRKKVL